MGCNENIDKWCSNDEKPSKKISFAAFFIDKYEVKVADYRQCIEAGECSTDGLSQKESEEECNWSKEGQDNHPVNCVNWRQAQVYCEWVGKRLPAEPEWEKAARGTEGLVYPWGNTWDSSKANTGEDGAGKITAVGTYPSGGSPYGAYDMAGNVWEWVSDWYRRDAYQYPAKRDKESGVLHGTERVVRGGSWNNQPQAARTSKRFSNDPDRGNSRLGFRCAKSAE